jgi:DNA primase
MPKEKKPFVDFRAIRARITMEQVLRHYGVLGAFKRTGNRLSGPCPIHNGSNPTQFRVDTEKNLWHCFSDCKSGGNVLDFIAKKEDISIHDAALKACEWFNIPLDKISSEASAKESDKPSETLKRPKAKPPSPSAPKPEDDAPNPPLKFRLEKLDRSHPYFTERGISHEAVIDFGLGYFTGEKGLMVGRIVIPIHNSKGELVAYAGRWPGESPKDMPKYKLPPGFKKGLELFNLDRAVKESSEKPLVIVEGFFDAIKLHQHGSRKVVALMGSTMSAEQEELIRQHTNSVSQVIVALDEDEAGRAGREDITCRLSKFCFVKMLVFEKPGTQPEHLSAEEVQRLLGGVL